MQDATDEALRFIVVTDIRLRCMQQAGSGLDLSLLTGHTVAGAALALSAELIYPLFPFNLSQNFHE